MTGGWKWRTVPAGGVSSLFLAVESCFWLEIFAVLDDGIQNPSSPWNSFLVKAVENVNSLCFINLLLLIKRLILGDCSVCFISQWDGNFVEQTFVPKCQEVFSMAGIYSWTSEFLTPLDLLILALPPDTLSVVQHAHVSLEFAIWKYPHFFNSTPLMALVGVLFCKLGCSPDSVYKIALHLKGMDWPQFEDTRLSCCISLLLKHCFSS